MNLATISKKIRKEKFMNLIQLLQNKTNLPINIIENIIKLLEEGCTIPFIARYRKELTNGASDIELRVFEEVFEY